MTREELLQTAKPILFNTEMVREILSGRKTQTRRVIRPRYRDDEGGFRVNTNVVTGESWVEKVDLDGGGFDEPRYIHPPYKAGDILYVRETYTKWKCPDGKEVYIYKTCDRSRHILEDVGNVVIKWHPSIHMPKEAARIFLKVTDVRVEQLQDITLQDVLNEGVKLSLKGTVEIGKNGAIQPFKKLWDSTVKDREQYVWNANPFVWVVEFERMEEN